MMFYLQQANTFAGGLPTQTYIKHKASGVTQLNYVKHLAQHT